MPAGGGFQTFVMPPVYASRMSSTDALSRQLQTELWPGELIVWSGQPSPLATSLSQTAIAGFGVLWTAFSVAGLSAMLRSDQLLGIVFLLVFVGVGIFMVATPLIQYRKAQGTLFAITDKRFLMLTNAGHAVRSVQLSAIRQVDRVRQRGGVTLRIPTALISDGDAGQKVDYTELHGVPDAETAYRLLTKSAI